MLSAALLEALSTAGALLTAAPFVFSDSWRRWRESGAAGAAAAALAWPR